jgi:BlaI family penicillinase repressor
MSRPPSRHPTELELQILKILWGQGPGTVREVQQRLLPGRRLAYTSVMTVMKIMTDKQYLRRSKEGNMHVYEACVDFDSTVGGMMDDLVQRLFDGSAAAASLRLLETADLGDEELKALRALLRRKTGEKS